MTTSDLEARVDDLYLADPKGFVARRDVLAKELKREGDDEGAALVKALRKPKQAAWALNTVAHDEPAKVEALRRVGDELRDAQAQAVGGRGNRSLHDVSDRRRDLIGELTDLAVERVGESQRDRIEATLEIASVDEELGDLLQAGRLVSDHDRPSGFGGFDAALALSASDDRRRRDDERVRRLEKGVQEADAERQRLASELERARERLAAAQEAVASAEQELQESDGRRRSLQAELDSARR